MVILGIDGGGSKTRAVVATRDGQVLGQGLSGASNYQGVGWDAAATALDRAMQSACQEAGVAPHDITAACLGLAGASRPEDQVLLATWAANHIPAAVFRLVNDAQLVLAAGTPDGWGLAVIAGTGSIAYALDPAGKANRAGGWGYLLGDEGSGYAIGLAALRAVMAAHDGRAPRTALAWAVLGHFALEDPGDLVQRVYRPPMSPGEIASLAVLVEQAALDGDEVAISLLREAARALVGIAAAAVRPLLMPKEIPTALSGSLLVHGVFTARAFAEEATAAGLCLRPLAEVRDPVFGAVRLALELLR